MKHLDKIAACKGELIRGHICKDCLKLYKRSKLGAKARANRGNGGKWGKGSWPEQVWSDSQGPRCTYHTSERRHETGRRRSAEMQATPKWADLSAIRAVYRMAAQAERDTGIAHEVDHIVPLRGGKVCGLHVHWNLQVLSRAENRKKSNRYWCGVGEDGGGTQKPLALLVTIN